MPSDVMEVTNHFMRNPIRILVKKEELTLEGIKQFYVQVMRSNNYSKAEFMTRLSVLRLSAKSGNWIRFVICTTL